MSIEYENIRGKLKCKFEDEKWALFCQILHRVISSCLQVGVMMVNKCKVLKPYVNGL
jgi:hypothetical protein